MSLARLSALNADAVYGSLAALEHDADGVDSGCAACEGHDKRAPGLVVGDIRAGPRQCAGDVSHYSKIASAAIFR